MLELSRINHKNIGWSPPPYESIKINFDAVVLTNKAAIDYVIRNYYGDLILASGKAILLYPVSYTKIMATWIGLFIAIKDLQFIDVYLEDDSS